MPNAFVEKMCSFNELSPEDICLLERASNQATSVPARQDLIREGDTPGPIFVILEGWACCYKLLPEGGRQITAFLLPGDCCDMHFAMTDAMDHSVCTLSSSRVAFIPRASMESLSEAHSTIRQVFRRTAQTDESVLRAWVVSVGRRTAIERVAHLMCELYLRARVVSNSDHRQMPLSQIVLADALGLTPVHVNRVLRVLRASDIMKLGTGTLFISDFARLAAVAGFDENYLHRKMREAA